MMMQGRHSAFRSLHEAQASHHSKHSGITKDSGLQSQSLSLEVGERFKQAGVEHGDAEDMALPNHQGGSDKEM